MCVIGLQVATTAAAEWQQRCAEAGYAVVKRTGKASIPSLWLVVMEQNQSPLARRFQLQRITAPIILVTEQLHDGAALAKWLPGTVLVVPPSLAREALGDLCAMALGRVPASVATL